MKIYLELQNKKSHDFWQIEVANNSFLVTSGKVGTKGKTSIKEFDDEETAITGAQKLIKQKQGKGYKEIKKQETQKKATKPFERLLSDDKNEILIGAKLLNTPSDEELSILFALSLVHSNKKVRETITEIIKQKGGEIGNKFLAFKAYHGNRIQGIKYNFYLIDEIQRIKDIGFEMNPFFYCFEKYKGAGNFVFINSDNYWSRRFISEAYQNSEKIELYAEPSILFKQLTKLKKLKISGLTPESNIEAIWQIPNLEELKISIFLESSVTISDEISKAKKLKALSISTRKITIDTDISVDYFSLSYKDKLTLKDNIQLHVKQLELYNIPDDLKPKLASTKVTQFISSDRNFTYDLGCYPNVNHLELEYTKTIRPATYPVKKVTLKYSQLSLLKATDFPDLEVLLEFDNKSKSFKTLEPFKKLKVLHTNAEKNTRLKGLDSLTHLEELNLTCKYSESLSLNKTKIHAKKVILYDLTINIEETDFDYFPNLEELILDNVNCNNFSIFKVPSLKKITILNQPEFNRPINWIGDVKALFRDIDIDLQCQKETLFDVQLKYKKEKFWNIIVIENSYTIQYGSIGSKGTTITKEFENEEQALAEAKKLYYKKGTEYYYPDDTFETLNDTYRDYRDWALSRLDSLLPKINISLNNQNIWLTGTLPMYKTADVKTKMGKLNSQISSKRTKDSTLLVIGLRAKIDELPTDIPILSAIAFEELVNQTENTNLEKTDNEGIENKLQDLLLSDDGANVTLAMDLMKEGGIPQETLSLLFGIFKVHRNKQIRAQAGKLIKLRGGETGKALMNICGRRNYLSMSDDIKPEKDLVEMRKLKNFNIEPFLFCIANYANVGKYALLGLDSDWTERFIHGRERLGISSDRISPRLKNHKTLKHITIYHGKGEIDLEPLWSIPTLEIIYIDTDGDLLIPKECENLKNLQKLTLIAKNTTLEGKLDVTKKFVIESKAIIIGKGFRLSSRYVKIKSRETKFDNLEQLVSKDTEILNIEVSSVSFAQEIAIKLHQLDIIADKVHFSNKIIGNVIKYLELEADLITVDNSKQLFTSLYELTLTVDKDIESLKPYLCEGIEKFKVISRESINIDTAFDDFHYKAVTIKANTIYFKTKDTVLHIDDATFTGITKFEGVVKSDIKTITLDKFDTALFSDTTEYIKINIPIETNIEIPITALNLPKLKVLEAICSKYQSSSIHLKGVGDFNFDSLVFHRLEFKFDPTINFNVNSLLIDTQKDFVLPISNFKNLKGLDFEGFRKKSTIYINGSGKYSINKLLFYYVIIKIDPTIEFDNLQEIKLDHIIYSDEVKEQLITDNLRKIMFDQFGSVFDFDLSNHPNIYELEIHSRIAPNVYPIKKVKVDYRDFDYIRPEDFPSLEIIDVYYGGSKSLDYFRNFKKLRAWHLCPYENDFKDITNLNIEEIKLYYTHYNDDKLDSFSFPKTTLKIKKLILEKIRIYIEDASFNYFNNLEELVLNNAIVTEMSIFKVPTLKRITILSEPLKSKPDSWLQDIKDMFPNVEILIK